MSARNLTSCDNSLTCISYAGHREKQNYCSVLLEHRQLRSSSIKDGNATRMCETVRDQRMLPQVVLVQLWASLFGLSCLFGIGHAEVWTAMGAA